jgi:hypothetical protein
MAAEQPHLQLGGRIRFDVGGSETTETGGDPVDGPVLGHNLLHQPTGWSHPLADARTDLDCGPLIRDGNDIVDLERPTINRYHRHRLLLGCLQNTNEPVKLYRTTTVPPVDETKRNLDLIVKSFAIAGTATVLVLSFIDFGETASPNLADGAALAAAATGSIGLLLALHWWSRAGESPRTDTNLMLHFIARVAVAELGVLMGILGLIMTGSVAASYVGLGLFLASLLFLSLGLRRID